MRFIYIIALLLAFAVQGHAADRVVPFKDAELTLTDAACDGAPKLKAGVVVFKDSRPSRKVCWIEEKGHIWIVDGLSIFSFPAENAKPKGVAL